MANYFTESKGRVNYATPANEENGNSSDGTVNFVDGNPPWAGYDLSSLNPVPKQLKFEENKLYTFVVVPYRATKWHTRVQSLPKYGDHIEEGEWTDSLPVTLHKSQGPDKKTAFACCKLFYNPLGASKSCPICEKADYNSNNDIKENGINWGSKRCLMNILLLEGREWKPYFIDHSYKNFKTELNSMANSVGQSLGIGLVDYAHGGATNERTGEKAWIINAKFAKESGGGISWLTLKEAIFKPRTWELTNEQLDQAIVFENYIKWVTYEETKDLMDGYPVNFYTLVGGKEDNDNVDSSNINKKPETNVDDAIGMNEAIMRANASEPVSTPRTRDKPTEDVCPFGHRFGYDCQKEGLAECKDTSDKGCPDESYTKCSDKLEQLKRDGLA